MKFISEIPQVNLFLIIFATFVDAGIDNVTCYGCEISNSKENLCNLSYQCAANDFCETIISRVDGHDLNIILSCATEEKCRSESSVKTLGDCEYLK